VRDGDGALAADDVRRSTALRHDLGLDLERDRRHRQHAAPRPEQPAHPVQTLHRVFEQLPQRHDQQVADGVVVHRPAGREPVLEDVAPQAPPVRVVAERGEGHAQVARREDAHLLPEASG